MRREVLVAGPDSEPYRVAARPGSEWVGLRCAPGWLPPRLEVPASGVRNVRIPLGQIRHDDVTRAVLDRAGDCVDPGRLLEAYARRAARHVGADRGASARAEDRTTAMVVALLRNRNSVRAVAQQLGLSERQLHRLSLRRFGYGPKMLQRILRMRGAVQSLAAGQPSADVAAGARYADQAHLSREVRALTGSTVTSLPGR